jgi:hypothetical protein
MQLDMQEIGWRGKQKAGETSAHNAALPLVRDKGWKEDWVQRILYCSTIPK